MQLLINHNLVTLDLPTGRVLLDVLRDTLGLKGTKEGCREGDCGACTVLLGWLENNSLVYQAVDSCLLPLGDCAGKHVVTIEGIHAAALNPLQSAFIDAGAVQCGFCTPGLIMALTAHLLNATSADLQEAIMAVAGNICRCTGYAGIRRAIERVLADTPAGLLASKPGSPQRLTQLITAGLLPDYFSRVRGDLRRLRQERQEIPPQPGAIVAGGTDLYVQRGEHFHDREVTLLADREDFKKITLNQGICTIGAAVTVETLRRSSVLQEIVPAFTAGLNLVAATQIRNRATVAGNIINASPIGDLTILLLALDATIHLVDTRSDTPRALPLRHFFTGYKTMQRSADELVSAFSFSAPAPHHFLSFEKVSKRTWMDIASVNSALQLNVQDAIIREAHVAAGGVAPIPLYLAKTSALLLNRKVDEETLAAAIACARSEITPISDVRGSAVYKSMLLGQLLRAHFVKTGLLTD